MEGSDAFVISSVPTPIDEHKQPDLSFLLAAIEAITPFLRFGSLLVIESTIFPGTCEGVIAPHIFEKNSFEMGKDYFLAHCPERVNPGDAFLDRRKHTTSCWCMFKKGVELAADLYSIALGGEVFGINETKTDDITLPNNRKGKDNRNFPSPPPGSITMMSRLKDAEAVKAMENTVRDVNIALVNELAKISDAIGLDVIDIINGMSTKPFGKGPYFPGVGVGGHCIAVDPEWLKSASERAGYLPGFIQLSRDTNIIGCRSIFSRS